MSESADVMCHRARMLGQDGLYTVEVVGGRIQRVRQTAWVSSHAVAVSSLSGPGVRAIDLEGRLLRPGLVDAHMHIDKAKTWGRAANPSGTLAGAIASLGPYRARMSPDEVAEVAERTARQALSHGTTLLRTYVDFGDGSQRAMEAGLAGVMMARDRLKGLVEVQVGLMFPRDGWTAETDRLMARAIAMGIDVIGGAPHLAAHPEANLDWIWQWGVKAGLPLDLHIDEHDRPEARTLAHLVKKVEEEGYPHRVIAGHLVSLGAVDEETAAELIDAMARLRIGAVTLPASNCYLQGRHDRGLVRRGLTRVRQLMEAGVDIAVASDNVEDAFNPLGSGDLVQMALLAAYGAHLATAADADRLLDMISVVPAGLLGRSLYGIVSGAPADFVVLDARSALEVLTTQSPSRWVFKGGRLAAYRRETRWQAGKGE